MPDRFQAFQTSRRLRLRPQVLGGTMVESGRGVLSLFSTFSLTTHRLLEMHSLSGFGEHPGGAHLPPRPASPRPPLSLTQARVDAHARGRAPPHTQQHLHTHTSSTRYPLPEAPSRQPRNTPGLPLACLRARTRTHALPAPPHQEGAQASGGGEPRAESWVHPALGFRAEAQGWLWFPDRGSWRWKQFTPLPPPRDPYTYPRAVSRSQEQTRRVNPQLRPGAASQLRSRSRLEAWRLDFRETPAWGLLSVPPPGSG